MARKTKLEEKKRTAKIKCREFLVDQHDSIHEVVNEQQGLPSPCTFICRNSANPEQLVYPSQINNGWRVTGNRGLQNIYTYFENTDANYAHAC